MGKRYFIFGFNRGDNWEEHAWRTHWDGVNREGVDSLPSEAQVVGDRTRVRTPNSAIGLDSQDVHMGGDLVVVEAETPDGKGGIIQTVHRYSDSGRFIGTYESQWDQTGRGQHTLRRTRRIFT